MRNQPLNMWAAPAERDGSDPLERERRRTLDLAATVLIVMCGASLPIAAIWALGGETIGLLVSAPGLATGLAMRLALARKAAALATHFLIASILVAGVGLFLLSPGMANFGLATALLAPVLAALFGDRRDGMVGWIVIAAMLALFVTAGGPIVRPLAGQSAAIIAVSAIVYATFSALVVIAATRINRVIADAEKAKIDAFHGLIDQLQGAVIRLSIDGKPLFISQSAEQLFGCKRYELNRSGLIDRMHVQDRPSFLTSLDRAHADGVPAVIEVRMRRDDPQGGNAVPNFVWIEIGISPVVAADTSVKRHECILMLRDITERKEHEHQMQAARKAAQDASVAKSRFLATIGHELRTPLNAIVGFSDMIRSELAGPLGDTQREYVELIHKSGLHLLEIVNMLLDMSKIEAGRFDLQLEPFAPKTLIEPIVQLVAPLAAERSVEIRIDDAAAPEEVVGDERSYRQILINLLSNAVKFSHPGGTVLLTLKRQGNKLMFSVRDEGIGMPAEVMKRVGEPFFQAHSGAARQYEGTGLGLSIVKGLIELHEGRLDIASKVGLGTTISVLMPLKGPQTSPVPRDVVMAMPQKADGPAPSQQPIRKSAV